MQKQLADAARVAEQRLSEANDKAAEAEMARQKAEAYSRGCTEATQLTQQRLQLAENKLSAAEAAGQLAEDVAKRNREAFEQQVTELQAELYKSRDAVGAAEKKVQQVQHKGEAQLQQSAAELATVVAEYERQMNQQRLDGQRAAQEQIERADTLEDRCAAEVRAHHESEAKVKRRMDEQAHEALMAQQSMKSHQAALESELERLRAQLKGLDEELKGERQRQDSASVQPVPGQSNLSAASNGSTVNELQAERDFLVRNLEMFEEKLHALERKMHTKEAELSSAQAAIRALHLEIEELSRDKVRAIEISETLLAERQGEAERALFITNRQNFPTPLAGPFGQASPPRAPSAPRWR